MKIKEILVKNKQMQTKKYKHINTRRQRDSWQQKIFHY